MRFLSSFYRNCGLIAAFCRHQLFKAQPDHFFSTPFRAVIFYLFLAACLFDLGCANRVSPSGGPKDESPPVVLKLTPENRSVNFNSKTIELKLNEFVTLNNPQTEIFISPFMKNRPDIKLRGKTLIVKFKQELNDSTTYTINFGSSIKDLSEGNALSNFEYAFSTGNQIDSLYISGTVVNADNGEPVKDALVLVYNQDEDSLFTTTPPAQISRTNENGLFRLSNLAAQPYYLFALTDKNASYFFDLPNESIAFHPVAIQPYDSVLVTPVLRLFNEGLDKVKIMERKNKEYGHIEVDFSKPVDSLRFETSDTLLASAKYIVEFAETKDTVHVWYKDIPEFSPVSFLLFNDTTLIDTVLFRRTIREMTLQPVRYISNAKGGRGVSSINYQSDLWLKFNHPIVQLDTSKIEVFEDSLKINVSKFISVSNYRKLSIDYDWKPEKKYKLVIPDSTLTDYFDETNEEITISFAVYNPDTYGTLLLNFKEYDPNLRYILKLFDKSYKLLREIAVNENTMSVPLLKPGEYKIVVVWDENLNGKWDTGNYAQQLQPETIFTTKANIIIKEDWETEVEILLK